MCRTVHLRRIRNSRGVSIINITDFSTFQLNFFMQKKVFVVMSYEAAFYRTGPTTHLTNSCYLKVHKSGGYVYLLLMYCQIRYDSQTTKHIVCKHTSIEGWRKKFQLKRWARMPFISLKVCSFFSFQVYNLLTYMWVLQT